MNLDGVLLIGDPPYFSRFGFVAAPDAVFAGPVDHRRVMWRPITDAAPIGAVPIKPITADLTVRTGRLPFSTSMVSTPCK